MTYDALLYLSFGGPEGMADVMPYLENVLRGKHVPRARMEEVAHHYEGFGGVSPINAQNRAVIAAVEGELAAQGISLPVYFGNRNWHPMLPDTLSRMQADGVRKVLVFVTSGFSCYSGCRQYRENVAAAAETLGGDGLQFDKIRVFYNHPGFVEANADHLTQALAELPEAARAESLILFTAHSIPHSMAEGSRYVAQLEESARLVAATVGREKWRLVYQSRSGPPHQPWLEPDVCDVLRELPSQGVPGVVIAPIGFVSDHMEILYDLDTEAREVCEELGLPMVRARTAGTHPAYVAMIRELIEERVGGDGAERRSLGEFGPSHDVCPPGCCAYTPARRPGT